jgi:hypothetical protein
VLTWLNDNRSFKDISAIDAFWRTIIPSVDERQAILEALKQHVLIVIQNEELHVTPKGEEYIEHFGRVPLHFEGSLG